MNHRGVIRVLVRARELIRVGWCQHYFVYNAPSGHLAYCASGAIFRMLDELTFMDAPTDLDISDAHMALGRTIWGSVTHWNDLPGRTQQDVLDAFDLTIERLERSQ